VIPAYTCFSVPAAVLKAGLRPVLCDINPSTFDFDHALLERTLNGNTLCVVAHHLFGIPSNIERVRALSRARGIFVVEDAAQAMGVESHGRSLGTLGDVGLFSLGRGKAITCGSGGIIVTNSAPDCRGHRPALPRSAAARSRRGVEGLRNVRSHGPVHPAPPVLASRRSAVSSDWDRRSSRRRCR
jgi:dTDP-4-amino-4,6-dideoxygalactose transaminase